MDIQSELDVYKFLQLINDNDKSDEGTVLFVKHLFAIGKLDYVKLLFGEEITIKHNVDIPYLVALENQLEQFADTLESFINGDAKKELSPEIPGDIRSENENLIKHLRKISDASRQISASNLPNVYESIVPHLLTAIRHIDYIRANKNKSGISTNIKDAKQFFGHLKDINFYSRSGLHFSF